MENIVLSAEEYSNIIAKIQFLQNKCDRLEYEKKELERTINEHKF